MSEKKNNRRKGLAVALAVVGIAGLSLASASQLSLSTNAELMAGVADLANCQGSTTIPVTFAEPSWDADSKTFGVESATLTAIDAECAGLAYKFVAFDENGVEIDSAEGDISEVSITATFTSPIDAAEVEGVALTIYANA